MNAGDGDEGGGGDGDGDGATESPEAPESPEIATPATPATSATSATPARGPQRAPAWYTAAWIAALPWVALYLCWRGLRQREYLRHWGERFLGAGNRTAALRPAPGSLRATTSASSMACHGENASPDVPVTFWIHAVSVGETHAAWPLIEHLAQQHPDARFVLTHMTPTGRAAGAEIARRLGNTTAGHTAEAARGCAHLESAQLLSQRYLPYDLPGPVRRFLRETRPDVGVLMETEIWPTLLYEAAAANIPVVLANARLSERSAVKAARFSRLFADAGANLAAVGAQTAVDRDRIARWFAGPIAITGNLKFDLRPDAGLLARGREWRKRIGTDRPLWLFASTREGEEAMLLDALCHAVLPEPRPRWLFVPRHPQRFDAVAALLAQRGLPVLRRSQWETVYPDDAPVDAPDDAAAVLLGDSMGEMPMYYAMADAAMIGGSLAPLGGQNLIEAAACGCPVTFGPHMFHFAQAAADAVACGAARQTADASDTVRTLAAITSDPALRAQMCTAAQGFAAAHRGATERMAAVIESVARGRRRQCNCSNPIAARYTWT